MVASLSQPPEIERHRAAIVRTDISRPVRMAIETEILTADKTFFDYGCGHGGDIERTIDRGFNSAGWDPYYRPDSPLIPSDIVNLGFVLNVIEDLEERRESLCKAWELTQQVLIVATQVLLNDRNITHTPYNDGIITCRNTFQKYYDQQELKLYIDDALGVDAVPVALGVYFVFRDDQAKETFRASRFRSRLYTPRVRRPVKRFEECEEQLQPLMEFVSDRGRLPVKNELPAEPELVEEFGSVKSAFKVVLQATDEAEWDAIAYRRSLDIQVYLALTQFTQRPTFKQLAPEIQHDIKAFFGNYDEACEVADKMLFSLGKPEVIKTACQKSKIGKRLPTALYVHVSALAELDPLLRTYEGCASRTIGRMDGATLIKFHTNKPKISYLFYPDFDTDPHPALQTSMQIDLQDLNVRYRDYSKSQNPPILHRKETFVTPNYPLYEEFAQLTSEEEAAGLLKNTSDIGTRDGWQNRLTQYQVEIREHQVYLLKEQNFPDS
ncbi:MAG: DNA phosphorothioation-associated putative methyltransferase [Crinalium sp.]